MDRFYNSENANVISTNQYENESIKDKINSELAEKKLTLERTTSGLGEPLLIDSGRDLAKTILTSSGREAELFQKDLNEGGLRKALINQGKRKLNRTLEQQAKNIKSNLSPEDAEAFEKDLTEKGFKTATLNQAKRQTARKAEELVGNVKEKLNGMVEEGKNAVSKARGRATQAIEDGKEALDDAKNKGVKKLEDVKQTAKQEERNLRKAGKRRARKPRRKKPQPEPEEDEDGAGQAPKAPEPPAKAPEPPAPEPPKQTPAGGDKPPAKAPDEPDEPDEPPKPSKPDLKPKSDTALEKETELGSKEPPTISELKEKASDLNLEGKQNFAKRASQLGKNDTRGMERIIDDEIQKGNTTATESSTLPPPPKPQAVVDDDLKPLTQKTVGTPANKKPLQRNQIDEEEEDLFTKSEPKPSGTSDPFSIPEDTGKLRGDSTLRRALGKRKLREAKKSPIQEDDDEIKPAPQQAPRQPPQQPTQQQTQPKQPAGADDDTLPKLQDPNKSSTPSGEEEGAGTKGGEGEGEEVGEDGSKVATTEELAGEEIAEGGGNPISDIIGVGLGIAGILGGIFGARHMKEDIPKAPYINPTLQIGA